VNRFPCLQGVLILLSAFAIQCALILCAMSFLSGDDGVFRWPGCLRNARAALL
jgi:hypothetical protein